jgi:glycosyltransferase involved in cell wall biosynthesis
MPGYRTIRRYSSAIIAGSKFVYHDLPSWTRAKTVYIPENGVDLEKFRILRTRSASMPLKAAFIARLVPYKGADIALEAMADFLKNRQVELHIIGDGPQRDLLEKLVECLKVREHVHFHGWLGHHEVHEILIECHFMASLVEGMRKAIEFVIRCPERLDKLGAAGRKKWKRN